MKNVTFFFILTTIALGGFSPEKALGKSNCDIAREKLDEFLRNQPSSCKKDDDCGSFYYRESCRGPVILAKAIVSEAFAKKFEKFKAEIKINSACAEEWKHSPACSPIASFPKCKADHCVDSFGQ